MGAQEKKWFPVKRKVGVKTRGKKSTIEEPPSSTLETKRPMIVTCLLDAKKNKK